MSNNNDEVFEGESFPSNLPENDNLSKIQWRTAEGQVYFIKDMADSHLRNAALFLMGMGYTLCKAHNSIRTAWLSVFRKEWERRMAERVSSNIKRIKASITEDELTRR